MKHKIAELEGSLLDAAVAKADGHAVRQCDYGLSKGQWEELWPHRNWHWIRHPSHIWGDAGPIIERERISIVTDGDSWLGLIEAAHTYDGLEGKYEQTGATSLIAAMRVYVKSKFGEEVEL